MLKDDLTKAETPNLIFAGTNVAEGNGKAVVMEIGMRTEFGKIAGLTQNMKEVQSPLQKELNRLTKQISVIAISFGVFFFAAALLLVKEPMASSFIFALGMVVAFIPEGLLPTVTLSLAMAVQRMSKRNALVKKLSSVETLGSTTVICTDKTGTLTQNEMTVNHLWLADQEYEVTGVGYSPKGEIIEQDMTFVGLVVMADPPRPEVAAAVEECRHAGIRIIMITGDYGLTAESIAKRIGIVKGTNPKVVSGLELEEMSDDQLKEYLKDEIIFARVAPEQKLRVVTNLQELGEVVAVTGDGVNDSPALKKADIGVAMGIAGTDVAKEASDMILTDDNFASIVHAIEEGRAVYCNIRKFLLYILNSNMPEAVPSALFLFSRGVIPLPLTVMA